MKTVFIVVFFGIMTFPFCNLQAQNDFALLEKNVNIRAKALSHKLNATKDTLVLISTKRIRAVYAVNMTYQREIDLAVNNTSINVPLTHLSKGKHVFVVEQETMRIVFVIKILRDNEILLASTDVVLDELKNE